MTVQMSVMISAEEIQAKVKELGAKIDAHYANSDKELVLIGLLRGSVIFMADLCRAITKPHELDFMTVSSYGGGTISSRDVKILKDLDGEIRGKDVLVVEDIIDSGNTLSKVLEILQTRQPNSIELCTLVSKPSRREIELEVKFLGFEVEDKFIVGYGLDYDQNTVIFHLLVKSVFKNRFKRSGFVPLFYFLNHFSNTANKNATARCRT